MKKSYILYGSIFIVVLITNILIRYKMFLFPALFSDDLLTVPVSLSSWLPPDTFVNTGSFVFSYLNKFIGDVIYIRIFYAMLLSISACLTFFILKKSFSSKLLLFIAIALAFTGPASAEQINFIMGSYPLLGFFLFTISCALVYAVMSNNFSIVINTFCIVIAGILLIIMVTISPVMKLAFMPLFFLPLIVIKDGKYKKSYLVVLLVVSFPVISLIVNLILSKGSVYHYEGLGWMSYDFISILEQAGRYIHTLFGYYFVNIKSVLKYNNIFWILITFLICLVPFLKLKALDSRSHKHTKYLYSALFLTSLFILTLMPALVTLFPQNRYYYVATLVLILLLFLGVDILITKFSISFRPAAIVPIALLLFIFNTNSSLLLQRQYDDSVASQKVLIELIRKESVNWKKNAQIIIITDKVIPKFTGGYNHWSTGFLHYHSSRDDIIGIIGPEKWCTEMPFHESYSNYGGDYWKSVQSNGKTIKRRKRMVGIITNLPVHAYRIDTTTMKVSRIKYLRVGTFNEAKLYDIDGIEPTLLKETTNSGDYYFDSLKIPNNQILNYKLPNNNVENIKYYDIDSTTNSQKMKLEFNGDKYLVSKKSALMVNLEKLNSFSIDFWIRNKTIYQSQVQYNDTHPPMPGIIGPVVLYALPNGNLRVVAGEIDSILKLDLRWTHIELNVVGETIKLYVNGKIYNIARFKYSNFNINRIILGSGFNKRLWKGEFGTIRILNHVRHNSDFMPQNDKKILLKDLVFFVDDKYVAEKFKEIIIN